MHLTTNFSYSLRSSANTSAIQSEIPGGWSSCGKCLDDMRLMQRLAISGLLSVILILLLTGTFITRRDLASVVDRGVAPEERNEQLNPAWVQDNVVPGQDEPQIEDKNKDKDKDRRLDIRRRHFEPSVVEAPVAPVPSVYVIRPPNPPLDDVTNQRREKVKEVRSHLPFILHARTKKADIIQSYEKVSFTIRLFFFSFIFRYIFNRFFSTQEEVK